MLGSLLAVGAVSALAVLVVIMPITWLATAQLVKLPLPKLTIGVGPTLAKLPVGPTLVELRPLPISCAADVPEERRAALVALAPVVVMLIVSSVLLGPARALDAFAHGFAQLVQGALDPARGAEWIKVGLAEPFALALGLAIAKLAALQLLPFAGSASWMAISRVIRRRPPTWLSIAMLVVMLAFSVQWLRAFIGAI